MCARAPFSTLRRHIRLALIAALPLILATCASQTTGGARGPTPTSYPTLEPWIPTLTPTNKPYSTAVPGTMPYVDGQLYTATAAGDVLAINPATGATKWSVSTGTSVGLLATGHALYVSYSDHLDALRLSDGSRLWSAAGGYPRADADGVLYIEKSEGIAAINDLTGTTRWTWTPSSDDEFEAHLIVGPSVVIVATTVRGGGGGSGYYGLYAVDKRRGVQSWKRPWGDTVYGAPFIVGDRVYFCSWTNSTAKLGAYTLASGTPIWERDWASFNARDGADIRGADDQRIYVGVGESGLAVLQASGGAIVWSHNPLLSSGGDLYPFAYTTSSIYAWVGGAIARFDAASGAQTWSQQAPGGGPVLLNNTIYLSGSSPDVTTALDAATGAIRWRFPAALSDLVVRNGVLFASVAHDPNAQPPATTGAIYALNAATGALYWKRDLPSPLAYGPFLEP
jgi:outer membrane protein assembly factor BamB